jgi:probable H4MPT-linked C1 transfer pathway protein
MATVIGWDLGGANLKRARSVDGRVVEVVQIPCPVIPDRSKFGQALGAAPPLADTPALHAVTMTGELSDVFATRAEGVAYLVMMMRGAVDDAPLLIYGGRTGFLDAPEAIGRWTEVASANWHASAVLAATHCTEGLFVDIGTTTADLIPLKSGKPAARGYSDGERLTEGELVYTGVVRTPLAAVAPDAPFAGRTQRIAAERFATMADVYRITGMLSADADPYPTADLRGKSLEESAARLARMLGRDASEAGHVQWLEVAEHFAARQHAKIEAAARVLIAREALGQDAPIIGAGCGRFLAARLAEQLGRPYRDFAESVDCAPEAREMAALCAPAAALAMLGERELARLIAGRVPQMPSP